VPIDCSNCHLVPAAVRAPGHLDGAVQIVFGGRALDRGSFPIWSAGGCSEAACHGANLVDPPAVVPEWKDTTGAATKCGACHGIPPTQHTPSLSCDRATCHGSEVTRDAAGVLSILPSGKTLHINGVIDHGL
jgi:predicted CxxxxCH...CXXCH cytochrome family protein